MQIVLCMDIFLISKRLLMEHMDFAANIMLSNGSDHWPIILDASLLGTPKNIPSRFKKFWMEHPHSIGNIKQWWNEAVPGWGSMMFHLQIFLKHIRVRIKRWNKEIFGDIFKQKKSLEDQMDEL